MLQKKRLSTPTTRFASVTNITDQFKLNFFLKKKKTIINNNSRKCFYKVNTVRATSNLALNFAAVTENYSYNKKPYQAFIIVKSIYNNNLILPGVEYLTPGQKIFDFTKNIIFKNPQYLGSLIHLTQLPYNLFMCCISNNNNNKWTFAKSSGTFITKLKAKKTVKLILVSLPSGETYLFLKETKGFIGKNINFFNNKFIEGKWGFSLRRHKTIAVRGVAMNPVDHPNGGRTKSKQPEKSPWGWIAKNKK